MTVSILVPPAFAFSFSVPLTRLLVSIQPRSKSLVGEKCHSSKYLGSDYDSINAPGPFGGDLWIDFKATQLELRLGVDDPAKMFMDRGKGFVLSENKWRWSEHQDDG